MKSPQEWQEQDLLQLIKEQQEENIELDFKQADALTKMDSKKKEISKDVSAFANSVGGTIIYGIAESSNEPGYAERITPIDPNEVSKEWLENVINSRIHPRISGVLINPVQLDKTAPGKFVYVVVVPQSDTAHQASDKRYYKRFNFQSVPMEDYEIRQTMNRTSRPNYEVALLAVDHGGGGNRSKIRFQAVIENMSEMVGHEVSVILFAPKGWVKDPDAFTMNFGDIPYSRIPGDYIESSTSMSSAVESAHPLVPYSISFRKAIFLPTDFYVRENRIFIVKVFDSFGLALSAKFKFAPGELSLVLIEKEQVATRASSSMLSRGL